MTRGIPQSSICCPIFSETFLTDDVYHVCSYLSQMIIPIYLSLADHADVLVYGFSFALSDMLDFVALSFIVDRPFFLFQ